MDQNKTDRYLGPDTVHHTPTSTYRAHPVPGGCPKRPRGGDGGSADVDRERRCPPPQRGRCAPKLLKSTLPKLEPLLLTRDTTHLCLSACLPGRGRTVGRGSGGPHLDRTRVSTPTSSTDGVRSYLDSPVLVGRELLTKGGGAHVPTGSLGPGRRHQSGPGDS